MLGDLDFTASKLMNSVESAPDACTSTPVTWESMSTGATALRFLLRQMRGELLDSRRVEFATQLVVRESTAPLRD
jgi:LacI family transcriptional regulator